eukprot:667095-Prorocentrum_minimum.AAC.1
MASHGITWHHMASHGITWHGITSHHITSHGITWLHWGGLRKTPAPPQIRFGGGVEGVRRGSGGGGLYRRALAGGGCGGTAAPPRTGCAACVTQSSHPQRCDTRRCDTIITPSKV